MSSIGRIVLSGGAANALGDVIECSGITHLQLFIKISASAGSLAGAIVFGTTPDGQGDLSTAAAAPAILVASNLVEVTARGTLFTAIGTDATFTFATIPTGTSLYAFRLTNPPQYVVPRYTYTSGGGTVQVSVYAYGFSVKT